MHVAGIFQPAAAADGGGNRGTDSGCGDDARITRESAYYRCCSARTKRNGKTIQLSRKYINNYLLLGVWGSTRNWFEEILCNYSKCRLTCLLTEWTWYDEWQNGSINMTSWEITLKATWVPFSSWQPEIHLLYRHHHPLLQSLNYKNTVFSTPLSVWFHWRVPDQSIFLRGH